MKSWIYSVNFYIARAIIGMRQIGTIRIAWKMLKMLSLERTISDCSSRCLLKILVPSLRSAKNLNICMTHPSFTSSLNTTEIHIWHVPFGPFQSLSFRCNSHIVLLLMLFSKIVFKPGLLENDTNGATWTELTNNEFKIFWSK